MGSTAGPSSSVRIQHLHIDPFIVTPADEISQDPPTSPLRIVRPYMHGDHAYVQGDLQDDGSSQTYTVSEHGHELPLAQDDDPREDG